MKANGIKCFLLKSIDETFFIRIYNDDGSFIDYDIFHNDLEIIINDDNAMFVHDDEINYIIEEKI